jgi:hypothetical protein
MTATRNPPRALQALTTTLVLALLSRPPARRQRLGHRQPGRPTAKTPHGAITTSKTAFKWSKVHGAAKYELRVSKGSQLLLKKTGLKRTTWMSIKALPTGVQLTGKVRASNARGSGAWSKSLGFKNTTGLTIGDAYGGGIVAYLDGSGKHGLIAAAADQMAYPPGIQWATEPNWSTSVSGALGTAIGTGATNTDAIGGFDTTTTYPWSWYWSSSQYADRPVNALHACIQYFGDGYQGIGSKGIALRVRAVRAS